MNSHNFYPFTDKSLFDNLFISVGYQRASSRTFILYQM